MLMECVQPNNDVQAAKIIELNKTKQVTLKCVDLGMTKDKLDEIYSKQIYQLEALGDPEAAHSKARDIILSILESHGYPKTVKAFRTIKKY